MNKRVDLRSASVEQAHESGEPVVQFIGVRKTYDRQHYAVDGVTFELRKGSFLTLLGPSGSGKSTCLHMLAGFENPDNGEIKLQGRSVAGVPPYRRHLGVVFQNYALFPNKTVYENVAYPMRVRRWPAERVKAGVDEALSLVRLAGLEGRYPRQLSGGQQQRVAIARAIVFRPAVVLMDEPLGALDRKLREELQGEIRTLHGDWANGALCDARSGGSLSNVRHGRSDERRPYRAA